MAACTVLSRAAASVLVAQVEVESSTGGTVTSTFEGQGEVVPSDEKQVFLWAEQQVEKSAAPGTAVKKGDCLVQFRMEYLKKSIDEKNSEIDQLKLQLEQQEVAARGSSYVSSADSAARTLDLAKAQLDAASEKADQAQAAYDSYAGESEEEENEEERQALKEALQAALSERDAAAQAVDEAQNAYEDAAAQDAAQEANNASAMESARLAGEEIQVQIDDAQKELDVLEEYQAAEGRLCAEEDCVVLENSVADGTVTTGAEVIVTGSGEWLLRGSLDEDSRKRIREGGKASVSMDSGERALDVEIRSVDTGEGSGNTGGSTSGNAGGKQRGRKRRLEQWKFRKQWQRDRWRLCRFRRRLVCTGAGGDGGKLWGYIYVESTGPVRTELRLQDSSHGAPGGQSGKLLSDRERGILGVGNGPEGGAGSCHCAGEEQ